MLAQKLRLQRGWSQEQLATISGLSVRTIQRIERGQPPALESLRSLAAIFEIDVAELQPDLVKEEQKENAMPILPTTQAETEEALAFGQVRAIKGFYIHAAQYLIVIPVLFVINWFSSRDYWWAFWPALGWGAGVLAHAVAVYRLIPFFGPAWEKRMVEKQLGRKL